MKETPASHDGGLVYQIDRKAALSRPVVSEKEILEKLYALEKETGRTLGTVIAIWANRLYNLQLRRPQLEQVVSEEEIRAVADTYIWYIQPAPGVYDWHVDKSSMVIALHKLQLRRPQLKRDELIAVILETDEAATYGSKPEPLRLTQAVAERLADAIIKRFGNG